MSERIGCCIPFCRRTTSNARFVRGPEWICAKHWGLAPVAKRRLFARAKRKATRLPELKHRVRCARLWDSLKAQITTSSAA